VHARKVKILLDMNHSVILANNKIHMRFKVMMEHWGIDGFKRKHKHFMKILNSTKLKFSHLFQIGAFLTNYYIGAKWTSHRSH
jgi:hypothetical protein